ncbi:uncharacterized protein LOC144584334 [Pogona vitticeps]
MKTLLGFLCLSMLLATAFSVECEKCPLAETCTPTKENCPKLDGCFTLQLESQSKQLITKDCMPKNECEELKGNVGKVIPKKYGNYPDGAIVRKVECSKAYGSPASLLLTLAGLLLMKLLF